VALSLDEVNSHIKSTLDVQSLHTSALFCFNQRKFIVESIGRSGVSAASIALLLLPQTPPGEASGMRNVLRCAAQSLLPDAAGLLEWIEKRAGPNALGQKPPLPFQTRVHGLGLKAPDRGYSAGDVVFSLPLEVWGPASAPFALEDSQASNSGFFQALCDVDRDLGGGRQKLLGPVALAAHLSMALMDRDNIIHPFARFLKDIDMQNTTHPLLLNAQELQYLQASPARGAVRKRQEVYGRIHHRLFASPSSPGTASENKRSSIHIPKTTFFWAISRVLSRAVSGPRQPLSFLPFFDLMNHRRQSNCLYGLDEKTGTLVVRSSRPIRPGEELSLCYSDRKDNHQMLVTYGFVEAGNPSGVTLRVDLPRDQTEQELGYGDQYVEMALKSNISMEQEAVLLEEAVNETCKRSRLSTGQALDVISHALNRGLELYDTSLERDLEALQSLEEEEWEAEGRQAWRRTCLSLLVEEKTALRRGLKAVQNRKEKSR